jgi:transcriptional regulator with XRE-family HTH domain
LRTNRDTSAGPRRDFEAGELLRELRQERFLTREEMPRAMLRAGVDRDLIPCARTLARIETDGAIPRERIRFGLAQFFDRSPRSIWGSRDRERVLA